MTLVRLPRTVGLARLLRTAALARMLRLFALSIAVLALVDPTCHATRRDRPLVSLLSDGSAAERARADEVRRALAERFLVLDGWLPAADAVLVLGDRWPVAFEGEVPTAPVFVLPPAWRTGALRWHALRAPSAARLGEAVPVHAEVEALGAPGDSLELELRQGDLLLARQLVPSGDVREPSRRSLTSAVVAVDTGPLALTVRVQWRRGSVRSDAVPLRGDVLVHVRADTVRVLSHDVRPSWQATFVRRALEGDPRLAVASRVTTSRVGGQGVTLETSAPPALAPPALASLPDPATLPVVVLGAAHALDAADVAALDLWVRRGGSAVLLLDEVPDEAVARWLGVTSWRVQESAAPRAVGGLPFAPTDSLVGRRWVLPGALPARAEPWLSRTDSLGNAQVVLWALARGRGTLVVAGAADAWEARAPSRSGFAALWPQLVLAAADRVPAARSVRVTPTIAASGAWREVEWQLADDAAFGATLDSLAQDATPDLVPAGAGRWRTAWRAHDSASRWPIGAPDTAPVHLDDAARVVRAAAPELLAQLAAWTGGAVLDGRAVGAAANTMTASVQAASRRAPWHPMRSPWWLVPFGGALVGEWWLRRRRGLP